MSKDEIIYKYTDINKDGELDNLIFELNNLSLYEMSIELPDLKESYIKVFEKTFKEEYALQLIDEDNFDELRKVVMDINCVKEEKISPNPLIRKFDEKSRRAKAQQKGSLTLDTILSSIVVGTGVNYPEMLDWTMFQLYMTYHRLNQFKNHDTTVIFSTIPTEKPIDIQDWSKKIDLYEAEKNYISQSEFDKSIGGLFN
ncbi:hypothetical protein [Oceanobacillus kimchii]|uniref:Uncharacterized protein n=1 Tax=Oceanobacillus kimchii TaxID=746691 RepID=A0ABQ5TKC5_9BACI|nr:hypothetical protein [Oceanobacillus kimchii]GLO66134.1 hypothetical protein MACH08_19180 [Oceanobacillus kimchii]